jgi:simple sugar transport system ATP-binding protein
VSRPIGFIPQDRTTEGLVLDFTLTENLVLASRPEDPWISGRRIDWRRARARTAELLERFGIVAAGPEARAGELSGGNQQKAVLARELGRSPLVVVAENPTRGLDIRAAGEVLLRLRAAAESGAAVLVHSTDLDEVLGIADRVIVLARGSVLEPPHGASRAEIGALMLAGGR